MTHTEFMFNFFDSRALIALNKLSPIAKTNLARSSQEGIYGGVINRSIRPYHLVKNVWTYSNPNVPPYVTYEVRNGHVNPNMVGPNKLPLHDLY